MKVSASLPPLPEIGVSQVDAEGQPAAFLRLERKWLRATFPDGRSSRTFGYDSVNRRALDAVVIAAWQKDGDDIAVYLRSAVRPPLLDRSHHPGAVDCQRLPCLWELPAGLIEPEELTLDSDRALGVLRAAARETEEELGFRLPLERFEQLGHGAYPSPAVTGERQYFAHVEIRDDRRSEPSLDGSPLEEHAALALVPLHSALAWCREGLIADSKTELALHRLSWRLKESK